MSEKPQQNLLSNLSFVAPKRLRNLLARLRSLQWDIGPTVIEFGEYTIYPLENALTSLIGSQAFSRELRPPLLVLALYVDTLHRLALPL